MESVCDCIAGHSPDTGRSETVSVRQIFREGVAAWNIRPPECRFLADRQRVVVRYGVIDGSLCPQAIL
jgi:hypothetical protein